MKDEIEMNPRPEAEGVIATRHLDDGTAYLMFRTEWAEGATIKRPAFVTNVFVRVDRAEDGEVVETTVLKPYGPMPSEEQGELLFDLFAKAEEARSCLSKPRK